MKVRIYGFELHMGAGITLDHFFTQLEKENGTQKDGKVLSLTKDGDFWTGVLISVKDATAFCQMQTAGKTFTVSAQELEKDTSIVDFNFFAIYAKTGRGLYQHYHHSASVSKFCNVLKNRYDKYKTELVEAEALSLGFGRERGREILAENKYAHSLRFSVLCRQESLEAKIDELERIKNIEMEFSSFEFDNDPLAPLSKVATRRTERLVFGKSNADLIKTKVKGLLQTNDFKKFKVLGVDPNGLEQAFKAVNDYDTFGVYEYNDLIKVVAIDSTNLVKSVKESPIIQKILVVANSTAKPMLTAPVQP